MKISLSCQFLKNKSDFGRYNGLGAFPTHNLSKVPESSSHLVGKGTIQQVALGQQCVCTYTLLSHNLHQKFQMKLGGGEGKVDREKI